VFLAMTMLGELWCWNDEGWSKSI